MGHPSFLRFPLVVYCSLTLCYPLLLLLKRRIPIENALWTVIALQFLAEIILESGIIYATGNINSSFSALFILTIVSAALAYGLFGTLVVATVTSVAYVFIVWLGKASGGNPTLSLETFQSVLLGHERVFYSIFLHVLIFYLIAFISGYLAERLKIQERQLVKASEALKRARLETDDILRHLNSGLLTIDSQGIIVYFNRAAERILGFAEEDVRGMLCEVAFSERMPSLSEALMEGIRYGRQNPRKEIDITFKGLTVPIGLSTSVLTDADHQLRGVIAIFSDLTEAKAMETKVRTADRLAAVGELSASIAHEIRNPLASISGSVEVLRQDLNLSGDQIRLMDLIVKESHRLSKILSEFLTYARIDRPRYNKVELCHVVSEVIEILVHHESYHDGIRLNFESDESIIYGVGDEDLFKQLLINLAVNACEAIADSQGELTFRLVLNHNSFMVELYVQDNGPGIAGTDFKRIYQPFFSTKKQGTGLGLAIVHRICSALKLNLSVESQQNEGTTFLLEIPIYQAPMRRSENVPAVSSTSA